MLENAIKLHERGFQVIPLNKKIPCTSWKKWTETKQTLEDVKKMDWENKNVGIITGDISNLTVVDFDIEALYMNFIKDFPELLKTFTIKTGKGYHCYFQYEEDLKTTSNQEVKLDIRSQSGIVAAEGSLHESGKYYEAYNNDTIKKMTLKLKKKILEMSKQNAQIKAEIEKDVEMFDEEKVKIELEKAIPNIRFNAKGEAVILCKFHGEKNPSLGINYKKGGKFRCFSCEAKGNAVDIIHKYTDKSKEEIFKSIVSSNYKGKIKNKTDKTEWIKSNVFYNVKEGFFVNDINGKQIYLKTKNDLEKHLLYRFPELWVRDEKNKRRINAIDFEMVVADVRANNQYNNIQNKIVLFNESRVELNADNDLIIYTKKDYFKEVKEPEVDREVAVKIFDDYMLHFPQLKDLLEFVIACRFTPSRKNSFAYLRVQADFGKTFLKSILINIGVALETDTYKLEKNPSPLKETDFLNTFLIIMDEFKFFPSSLKNVTNEFAVSEKYKAERKVEVFGKLFLSAEKSQSFFNGVDEQIQSRVAIIDLDDAGKITERAVYKRDQNLYFEVVQYEIYKTMKYYFNLFIEMGEKGAEQQAQKFLNAFHRKYKIDEKKNDLLGNMKIIFYHTLTEILEEKTQEKEQQFYNVKLKFRNIWDNFHVFNDKIIVQSLNKTLEEIFKKEGEDFYKKTKYKQAEYERILDLGSIGFTTINKKSIRGHSIEVSKILDFIKGEDINTCSLKICG